MPEKEMKYSQSVIQVNLRKQKGMMLKNIDDILYFRWYFGDKQRVMHLQLQKPDAGPVLLQ